MRLLLAGFCATLACIAQQVAADPLTWGEVVTRTASGCDAFTPVLGPDGHHYTSFGDCGGLTGVYPKLSMGFGRIIGGPIGARVQDLPTPELVDYGNRDSGRKPSSAIVVGHTMYIWVRNYGPNGTQARLKYSSNFTKNLNSNWTWAPFTLPYFGYPVFVQDAPGSYIYIAAHDNNAAYIPASHFVLLRAPKVSLTDNTAYEYFSGTPTKPKWAKYYTQRRPIFTDGDNCYRSGMSYSKARGRYYWWQNNGDATTTDSFSVWSGPEPWGPWKRVFFTGKWDIDAGERGEFPPDWIGSEPLDRPGSLYLLFSGGDRLTIRKATIAAGL